MDRNKRRAQELPTMWVIPDLLDNGPELPEDAGQRRIAGLLDVMSVAEIAWGHKIEDHVEQSDDEK